MAESDDRPQPGLICWSCRAKIVLADLLKHGIIRARTDREGGPFRIHTCASCERDNMCERTARGRWFSSPTFQPKLMDFVLGKLFLHHAEEFLTAASWYEDNEARRRYFFERDGDRRYSTGILGRLLSRNRLDPRERYEARGQDGASRARESNSTRESPPRDDTRSHSRPRPSRPRVLSPWEILGVEKSAGEREVRRAFHRLAIQYHPDKVHHLGEEFQRMATAKFKELQKAYDSLLRSPPSY